MGVKVMGMDGTDSACLAFSGDSVRHAAAGSIVYPPGGRFGPRIQQDIQLVLLYTGEMTVKIDGNPLRVQPGHVVLLKPGHEESFAFAAGEETWHRWISLHVSPLPQAELRYLYSLPAFQPLSDELSRLTDVMLSLQSDVSPVDPLCRNLGLAALQLYAADMMRTQRQSEKHPAIHLATAWIREHYADDITLQRLAFEARVSPEHLSRLFRRFESVPPMQYVWNSRIKRGLELLVHTGLTVAEVAHRCGFKNPHHFARMVKQSTGRTPSQVRSKSWGSG